MKGKRAYLMSKARRIPELVELQGRYDEAEQVNVEDSGGVSQAFALNANSAWTGSKTMSAPGDDDPDPEDGRCY